MEYRVRRTEFADGTASYDFCEVAMVDGKPVDIGVDSVAPIGSSVGELGRMLADLLAALAKPTIDEKVELADWGVEGALDLAEEEDDWETEWQRLYNSKV